ncbi:MAG: CRISPR-associated protein Csx3 [bacterium]|nr:CRISPR-associated protein Csx3 [bacterium]
MSKNLELSLINTQEDFQILNIRLTGNGLIDPSDLKDLNLPNDMNKNTGVIINGKSPVFLFSALVIMLRDFKWIATFAPQKGGIVIFSNDNKDYKIGDLISIEKILKYITGADESDKVKSTKEARITSNKVIALVGPANSGKSVFLRELRKSLNSVEEINFRKDYFIIRACPDGEGDWFGDIQSELGKILRFKNTFDDEFIDKITESIINTKKSKNYILVDCGGKIDKKNQKIFNECTDAIIISSDDEKAKQWLGAIKICDLNLLFEIESVMDNICRKTDDRKFQLGKLFRDNTNVAAISGDILDLINN